MSLDWSRVQRTHVEQACELLVKREQDLEVSKGLYVLFANRKLPVKDVLRLAYRFANALPENAPIKFASGESSLNRLRRLQFVVGRQPIDPQQRK